MSRVTTVPEHGRRRGVGVGPTLVAGVGYRSRVPSLSYLSSFHKRVPSAYMPKSLAEMTGAHRTDGGQLNCTCEGMPESGKTPHAGHLRECPMSARYCQTHKTDFRASCSICRTAIVWDRSC